MRDEDKTKEDFIRELETLYYSARESEERWRLVLEGAADGVWDWNIQTNEVFYSKKLKEVLGYGDNEISNYLDEWTKRIHPEDTNRVMEHIEKFLSEGVQTSGIEHRIECKDQTYKWVFLRGKIMSWAEDGRPLVAVGTFTDINECKQIEQRLRTSEEKFRKMADAVPASIFIYQDDYIRYANPYMISILGCTAEEILNMHPWDFIHPAVREEVKTRSLARREGNDTTPRRYEIPVVAKNGEEYWGDCSVASIEYEGKPAVIGFVYDITERKESERLLKQAEEKYRGIFDNAVMGIFQSNSEGRYITVNNAMARMCGYETPEEMVKTVISLENQVYARREDRHLIKRFIDELGSVEGFQTRIKHKDGNVIWVLINTRAVKGGDGSILYYEGTVEDIAKRKQAEEGLQRSEAELRALIESMNDVIVVIDTHGRFVKIASTKQGHLWKSGEKITCKDVFPRETAAHIVGSVKKALKTNQTVTIEYSLDIVGKEYWFSASISPMTYESAVCVARDITGIKMAENALQAKSVSLEETNTALKILLKNVEEAKRELEENVVANIKTLVMPYIEKVKKLKPTDMQMTYLNLMEENLKNIASPFLRGLSQFNLTPTEIQVANYIRDGKTTKEIVELLHVSKDSIDIHRYNIRRKLGINKKKFNLRSRLLSIL